jgi:hypothetical protein
MKRVRTTAEAAELGRELLAVKQQLGHGHFLNYLKDSQIGEDSAHYWMRIARQVDTLPELLDLQLSMAYRVVATRVDRKSLTDSIIAIKRQWRERDVEEAIVSQLRAQGIQAERQVSCPAGRIDIVTSDALYEVELFLSRDVFFHALGQILLYRQSFDPTKKAIIVGFADPGADITDLVVYARQLNVEVQFWSIPTDETSESMPSTALELLYEVADTMAHLELSSHELPTGAETERALGRIERSAAAIRSIIRRRGDVE